MRRSSFVRFIQLFVWSLVAISRVFTFALPTSQRPLPSTQQPLRVGVVLPLDGPLADYGLQARLGIELALAVLKEQNAPIQVWIENSGGTPMGTSQAVNTLLGHRVDVILGEMTTANTEAAIAPIQTVSIPLISIGSTYGPLTLKRPLVSLIGLTDEQQALSLAVFARKHLAAKTAGIVVEKNNLYSEELGQEFAKAFAREGGQVSMTVSMAGQDQNYDKYARQFRSKSKELDVIFAPLYYGQAAPFIRSLRDHQIKVNILGSDGFDSEQFLKLAKGSAEGVYFTTHFNPETKSAASQKFYEHFGKTVLGQKTPPTFTIMGYDALMLAYQAFQNSKSQTRLSLAEAIGSMQNFEGVSGLLSMNSKRHPVKPTLIMTVEDGKKKLAH